MNICFDCTTVVNASRSELNKYVPHQMEQTRHCPKDSGIPEVEPQNGDETPPRMKCVARHIARWADQAKV